MLQTALYLFICLFIYLFSKRLRRSTCGSPAVSCGTITCVLLFIHVPAEEAPPTPSHTSMLLFIHLFLDLKQLDGTLACRHFSSLRSSSLPVLRTLWSFHLLIIGGVFASVHDGDGTRSRRSRKSRDSKCLLCDASPHCDSLASNPLKRLTIDDAFLPSCRCPPQCTSSGLLPVPFNNTSLSLSLSVPAGNTLCKSGSIAVFGNVVYSGLLNDHLWHLGVPLFTRLVGAAASAGGRGRGRAVTGGAGLAQRPQRNVENDDFYLWIRRPRAASVVNK